jgi:hypothetical protein
VEVSQPLTTGSRYHKSHHEDPSFHPSRSPDSSSSTLPFLSQPLRAAVKTFSKGWAELDCSCVRPGRVRCWIGWGRRG